MLGAFILILVVAQSANTAGSSEDPLFTRYFSITTPLFTSEIPPNACQALIAQADGIYQRSVQGAVFEASKILRSKDDPRLQIAGENLRSCATNDSLLRHDRDMAIDLYAWVRIDQKWREHFQR